MSCPSIFAIGPDPAEYKVGPELVDPELVSRTPVPAFWNFVQCLGVGYTVKARQHILDREVETIAINLICQSIHLHSASK